MDAAERSLISIRFCGPLRTGSLAAALLLASTAAFLATPIRAQPELDLTLFSGQAFTADSDVRLTGSAGLDLNFRDVAWDTKPAKLPPYWGVRLTGSSERLPDWDFAADLLHAKMYSDLNGFVTVSGRRDGAAVDTTERLGDTFDVLEFTDGHNLLTANALRKWQPSRSNRSINLPYTLYAGGGLGVAIPHVEVTFAHGRTSEYQLAGPAAQFLAGASLPFGDRFVVKTEYRLTWADLDTDVSGPGRLRTEALTQHVNIGVGFRFGGAR